MERNFFKCLGLVTLVILISVSITEARILPRDSSSSQEYIENLLQQVENEIQNLNDTVQSEVNQVESEVNDVKSDVDDVKTDVNEVKSYVDDVKSNMRQVNGDVDLEKSVIGELYSRMDDVRGEVKEVREEVDEVKEELSELKEDVNVMQWNMTEVNKYIADRDIQSPEELQKELDSKFQLYRHMTCRDIRKNAFPSKLLNCRRACDEDTTCTAVVYWPEKMSCYKRVECEEKHLIHKSGMNTYIKTGKNKFIEHQSEFCVDTQNNAVVSELESCKLACELDADCAAVVYWPEERSCYKRYKCTNDLLSPHPDLNVYIKRN